MSANEGVDATLESLKPPLWFPITWKVYTGKGSAFPKMFLLFSSKDLRSEIHNSLPIGLYSSRLCNCAPSPTLPSIVSSVSWLSARMREWSSCPQRLTPAWTALQCHEGPGLLFTAGSLVRRWAQLTAPLWSKHQFFSVLLAKFHRPALLKAGCTLLGLTAIPPRTPGWERVYTF